MSRRRTLIDYPQAELAELAEVLETTTTNAVRRACLMRLAPVCDRCGGCGSYSFNQTDGSTCYGCSGAGHVVPRKGDLPAVIERARSAVAGGELSAYLDRIDAARVAKGGQARLLAAYGATEALRSVAGWSSHAYPDAPGNAPAVRVAISAMHKELKRAEDCISAWQYPPKGTSPTGRQELALAARVAIDDALAFFAATDLAPDAEFVAFIHDRQRASWEARKRGPWAHSAPSEPELYQPAQSEEAEG